ncbi:MAG: DUF1836 domain-containing protein [Christensenellales bacterium]|jgi:DNA-binding transcriptional MerR regulator
MQSKDVLSVWKKSMESYRLPRWNDLPDLDLYMDQVVSLIERTLKVFSFSEQERMITPAMINNYVKLGIVPPPQKKRYSREHVARLIMLSLLKQVLSISQINQLLRHQENGDISRAYNAFCDNHESTLRETVDSAIEQGGVLQHNLALELATLTFATKSVAARLINEQPESPQKTDPKEKDEK